MKKSPSLLQLFFWYLLGMFFSLGGGFLLHIGVLYAMGRSLFEHHIIAAYSVNGLLIWGIVTALFLLRNRYKDQLGFLFMFGSLFKFAAFFLFFYADYKADGVISRPEFFAFFIPYTICSISGTTFLIRLLNYPEDLK